MVPASVSSRSKCPEAGGVWQVQGAERRTMTGAEAVGEEKTGGGVSPRRADLVQSCPRGVSCVRARAPEDLHPQTPRLPEARLEHATRSHEWPRPGAAGRPAVLCARSWPVVPGLHPDHQFEPLHPKAVPAFGYSVRQRPDHRPQ
ncbi:uncharacterized protein LOC103656676 isoform X2 [Ursus maritimus]|uniref:Uncharacterized protein LOC103656676 isoform X2 n=1 Tax=Ursus maritimus TaxID=29073 RepID=A0A8M1FEG0_URSMA|nr:uncharacterized protein LOC103656676 isoform X2 [Ursus maritimus]